MPKLELPHIRSSALWSFGALFPFRFLKEMRLLVISEHTPVGFLRS